MTTILAALAALLPSSALARGFPERLDSPPRRIVVVDGDEWRGETSCATLADDERAVPEMLMGREIDAEWAPIPNPGLIVATCFGDLADVAVPSRIPPLRASPRHLRWGAPWREELRLLAAVDGDPGLPAPAAE